MVPAIQNHGSQRTSHGYFFYLVAATAAELVKKYKNLI